jgi:hypothetical protein
MVARRSIANGISPGDAGIHASERVIKRVDLDCNYGNAAKIRRAANFLGAAGHLSRRFQSLDFAGI